MKTLEKTKDWPSKEEALRLVRNHDIGYVRVDGAHSATSEEKVELLYDVVRPRIEGGTYGRSQEENNSEAYREAFIKANGGAIALSGGGSGGGGSDNSVVLALLQEMKESQASAIQAIQASHDATVEKLEGTITSLEERLAEVEKPVEVAPAVAEASAMSSPVTDMLDKALEAQDAQKVDPATGKTAPAAATPKA